MLKTVANLPRDKALAALAEAGMPLRPTGPGELTDISSDALRSLQEACQQLKIPEEKFAAVRAGEIDVLTRSEVQSVLNVLNENMATLALAGVDQVDVRERLRSRGLDLTKQSGPPNLVDLASPSDVLIQQGVRAWNRWRVDRADGKLDLRAAMLSERDLREVDLRGADLSGAYLRESDLRGANLSRADLSNADLRGTYLDSAVLSWTDLGEADFTDAITGWTLFAHVDLSMVKGLETVKHIGPSAIDIDTLYASRGKVPASFLRSAGIPENFIDYSVSLAGKPFEFYSCFVSYSHADQLFAERIVQDLEAHGVRCWFAPHHLSGGKPIHEQIDEAIRLHDKLLLILSEASMQSGWVQNEISKARQREFKEGRRVLFPITIANWRSLQSWRVFDADTGKDSAREVREYFIPDFSHWKDHQSYQQAFERLLRDLRAAA